MQTFVDLTVRLGLFYVFIVFGVLIARFYHRSDDLNRFITNVLIYLLLPPLFIKTFLGATLDVLTEMPTIIVMTLVMHVLGLSLLLLFYRGRVQDTRKKGAHLLCVTFNNGIFLPIPLALIFIGETSIPIIAIFSITQMLLFATLATLIGVRYSDTAPDWPATIKRTLTFPPLLAAIMGMILMLLGVQMPSSLEPILAVNSMVTTYSALFVVGLGLGSNLTLTDIKSAIPPITIRQAIVPLIIALLLLLIAPPLVTGQVLLLEAMMPPAVITVVFATALKLDSEAAATVVTIGTILLLPVIPLFWFFLA
ncbi:MAG: AEC family transporter [Candidatus Thorarchaeota archaeon]|nr:AEC family transporter [Candidatus Thorarchaeota archaeon]